MKHVHDLSKRMGNKIDKINLEENVFERIQPCKKLFKSRLNPKSKGDLIPAKIYAIRNRAYNKNRYLLGNRKRRDKRFSSEDDQIDITNLSDKEFQGIDPRYDEDSVQANEPHIRKKRN